MKSIFSFFFFEIQLNKTSSSWNPINSFNKLFDGLFHFQTVKHKEHYFDAHHSLSHSVKALPTTSTQDKIWDSLAQMSSSSSKCWQDTCNTHMWEKLNFGAETACLPDKSHVCINKHTYIC